MRKSLVRGMAQEIRHHLVQEMEPQGAVRRASTGRIADLLLDQLADEVLGQLQAEKEDVGDATGLEARISHLESLVEQLVAGAGGDDDDDDSGAGNSLPNLKYAKPKYKDVESVLKYIESDEDKGAIKLVIMNFND